jgi:hypothetical protein
VIVVATATRLATAIIDRPTALSVVLAWGPDALALAALGGVIGRAAFGLSQVTWHRVRGAVALYLVLGLRFAHLYGLTGAASRASFVRARSSRVHPRTA